jgi:hypothetical protein
MHLLHNQRTYIGGATFPGETTKNAETKKKDKLFDSENKFSIITNTYKDPAKIFFFFFSWSWIKTQIICYNYIFSYIFFKLGSDSQRTYLINSITTK